ncbi:SARP family transcriptional regulator [Acrocarpospora corrugata]|uniref:SARP family transcriptional regulator n=1 Tax=Acrocarpospora corrugata TaxID=35763 RepID=A0A5M3W8Q0_9ACTN|nr:BTAD domain-containing putative transcriptional regulator [Acrocarpospora corrugata]GES04382.1 SARP family transcriptional regulator [Acrocarpospora corrugata]
MRFGVLGPLAVWTADGRAVTIPGLKVRALLADLLVHEGRTVSVDRLVDDLWGDDAPANPAGALQVKVSQLRRALDEAEPGARELVVSHSPGYALRTGLETVDAARFTQLTTQAQDSADPRTVVALLGDALALWRGTAFADFADDEFTRPAIARLDEQRLAALEQWAEARLELGEHSLLAGELADLTARHPLRERLRAAHIRALYMAGRQSEALADYADLRDRLADELGLDPSPELVALHQAILNQDPALSTVPGIRTNLPEPLSDLIGRENAVTEVSTLLEKARLVTLTGSGGVGKTRLALETARGMAFPDGVWLVELAALNGSCTAEAIMAALEIHDSSGEPQDRLIGALRARNLLLVLDNCEHVIDDVAKLADALLRAAPQVRILATSQEALSLPGESVWSVPPLDVPSPTADLAALDQSSAVRLFVARATAAARDFTLDTDTAPAVAMLCRRLDGIPLALELAATRVRALGVHGLVARLDDRFRLLATGHRGAPPRQQTLTAMIDWSWELLTDPERIVLRRLAIHADGCTLEAAEAVCATPDVLDLLPRLVDRSLVAVAHGPDGPRYRLLESVAAYCVDRMREADEYPELQARHRAYYTDLAEQAQPHLYGPAQRDWLRRLDAEAANFRTAVNLRLVNALTWYWFLRGRLTEARRSLETALAQPGTAPAADRAAARAWQAGIALLHGDVADKTARREAALKLFDTADDPARRARAQWFLAYTGSDTGDLTAGADLLDQALATFRELGDRWGEAAVLSTQAKLAHVRGDLAALGTAAERSNAIFSELGERWGQLEATGWLGAHAELAGDYDEAERRQRDGLAMAEELGLWAEVSTRLSWLGWIALQRGDYAQSRLFSERALRLATEQAHLPGLVFAELTLGFAARKDGLIALAETHLTSVLRRTAPIDEANPPPHLPMVLAELGFAAEQRGAVAEAVDLHRRAFTTALTFDAPRGHALAAEGLAGAFAFAADHGQAARLLGAAARLRTEKALPLAPAERRDVDRIAAATRAALGDTLFKAEFNRGAEQPLGLNPPTGSRVPPGEEAG